MLGNPLQIGVRTEKWRFTWQTVHTPFQPKEAAAGGGGAVELLETTQLKHGLTARDAAVRNPDAVNQFRRQLETYITRSQQAWKTKTPDGVH